MIKKNSITIEKLGIGAVLIALIIYLLSITRSLVMPFVIALIIFYIFTNVSHKFSSIISKKFKISSKISNYFATPITMGLFVIVIYSFFNLASSNITSLMAEAPKYEQQLKKKLKTLQDKFQPTTNIKLVDTTVTITRIDTTVIQTTLIVDTTLLINSTIKFDTTIKIDTMMLIFIDTVTSIQSTTLFDTTYQLDSTIIIDTMPALAKNSNTISSNTSMKNRNVYKDLKLETELVTVTKDTTDTLIEKSGKLYDLKQKILDLIPEIRLPNIGELAVQKINFPALFSGIGGAVTSLAKNGSFILIYLLFLALEKRQFKNKIDKVRKINPKFNALMPTIERINRELISYFKIKFLASFATGFTSFIIMVIMGVDFASFWAVLIFVLNFIPTVGSIIAVIFPILLSLILFDSGMKMTILASTLISVQLLIGNILEPRYMGKTLNLSALTILISLAVWGKIWGLLGMFLSVPIMVAINIILANIKETQTLAVLLSADGDISLAGEDESEDTE